MICCRQSRIIVILVQSDTLATGGAVFHGFHLCECLLDQECEVLWIDIFSVMTGRKWSLRLRRTALNYYTMISSFPLFVEENAIYNLASSASPAHYQRRAGANYKKPGKMVPSTYWAMLCVRFFPSSRHLEVYEDPKRPPKLRTAGTTSILPAALNSESLMSLACARPSAVNIKFRWPGD